MKPIKNKSVILKPPIKSPGYEDVYRCQHCGAAGSGIAIYSEVIYGHATVSNMGGELDDYESDDFGDGINILNYRCTECDREADTLEELFTNEPEEEEEDDE